MSLSEIKDELDKQEKIEKEAELLKQIKVLFDVKAKHDGFIPAYFDRDKHLDSLRDIFGKKISGYQYVAGLLVMSVKGLWSRFFTPENYLTGGRPIEELDSYFGRKHETPPGGQALKYKAETHKLGG